MDTEAANMVMVKPVPFNLSMESVNTLLYKTPAQDYHYSEALEGFAKQARPVNRRRLDKYVAKEVANGLVPWPLPEITSEIFTTAAIQERLLLAEVERRKIYEADRLAWP